MVRILLQPAGHEVVSARQSDTQGNTQKQKKIFRQQSPHLDNGRPQYFPDADFLRPLLRHKGGHTKNPQAADEDGKDRKRTGQLTRPFFTGKLLIVFLVYEFILERRRRHILLKDGPDPVQRLAYRPTRLQPRKEEVRVGSPWQVIDHLADGLIGRSE